LWRCREVGKLEVRPASQRDVEKLSDLCAQLGYPSAVEDVATRLGRISGRPDHCLLVAEIDGEVVGWVHVCEALTLESGACAVLAGLVVDEGHRSRGVGAQLLRAAEEWARRQGYGRIIVRSNVVRERAHRFYEREGYTLVKTSRVFERRLE